MDASARFQADVRSIGVTAPRKTAKRFLGLTALFAFVHWLLLIASFGVAFGRGIHRLDHPEFPVTLLERICRTILAILQQPYEAFDGMAHFPRGWVTLTLGLLNSLLWGATFALIFLVITQQRQRVAQA